MEREYIFRKQWNLDIYPSMSFARWVTFDPMHIKGYNPFKNLKPFQNFLLRLFNMFCKIEQRSPV